MIEQSFEFVGESDKYGALTRLLEREMDGSRLLIFCETKRGCDSVTRQLRTEGWPALSIHGDKSQQERDWVLAVSAWHQSGHGVRLYNVLLQLTTSVLAPLRKGEGVRLSCM